MNVFRIRLAKNIRSARIEREMTQVELAQMIGKTGSTISQYENARRLPDVMTMSAMSEVLGISLDDLVPDVELEVLSDPGQTSIYDLIGE